MWSGHIFSLFHGHFFAFVGFKSFWHFAHFRNAQKQAIRLYIFLLVMSVFGIWPIFEMHRDMWSGHIFSRFHAQPVVVVVGYPTPSEGWGHGGRPWSPRSRATPQGLDQRSYRDRESPKSEPSKESVAGQCRMT